MNNLELLESLIQTLPDAEVNAVYVGLHWTAVVARSDGEEHCGLAATQFAGHHHGDEPDVPQAGELANLSGKELANLAKLDKPTLASIGMAAINAILPREKTRWVEANAEKIILQKGHGKKVVVVGHFPFVPRLRQQVGELSVLELEPRPGDLPAEDGERVLPQADIVAITSMTLINHTLAEILKLCPAGSFKMMLGPSTPLSPVMFDYGIQMLSGSVVTAIDPVLKVISQGGNFRQVHQAGVRLVNMLDPQVAERSNFILTSN